nr:MAG TPA: replisome organizer [Caudoviricetes sp.]
MAMTKSEFKPILAGIIAAYPNFKVAENKESLELWYQMLSDLSSDEFSLAVKRHIGKSSFPPTIADIRKCAAESPELKRDWSLGWGLVLEAVRKFGYYNEEAGLSYLAEKDIMTAEVVRRLGFQNLCLSENLQNDRANFRMAYEVEMDKRREYAALPAGMREHKSLSMSRLALEQKSKADDVIKLLAESKSMAEEQIEKKPDEVSGLSGIEKLLAYIERQKGERNE